MIDLLLVILKALGVTALALSIVGGLMVLAGLSMVLLVWLSVTEPFDVDF